MRLLLVLILIFISKLSYSYDFVDQRNSPLIVAMDDNEWNLVTDKNYIPVLQFKDFYDNLNEPQLSIYIDTKEKIYRELYTYLSNDLLIETQLDLYREGKNLSTEDKKLSYTKFIDSILTLNKKQLQKVTDLSKYNLGFTKQNKILDHFHVGKFIEQNENSNNDKYCSIFYFWSEKIKTDTYKVRVQSVICNLDIQSGTNPFLQDKIIENFVKNIYFFNEDKFKDLYIDEITRLKNIKIKKEKEKEELRKKEEAEKKRKEEEERIANEKAKQQEKKLKEDKSTIEVNLIKLSDEIALTLKQINYAIKDVKSVNQNFNPSKLVKRLNDYTKFYEDSLISIQNNFDNIDELILKFEGDKSDLISKKENLSQYISSIKSSFKEYKKENKKYLSNVKKRELWVIKDKKQKAEAEKKKKQEELKKRKEIEKQAELKKKIINEFKLLIDKERDIVLELENINDELIEKLNLNKSENFVEEILLIQEKDRAFLEDRFIKLKELSLDLANERDDLNSKHSYTEQEDLNNVLLNLEVSIKTISRTFNNNNLILKNLILSNIELKEQEKENQKFIYLLLIAIIVLIIILIIVFIYFIRANKKNRSNPNKGSNSQKKADVLKTVTKPSDNVRENNNNVEPETKVEIKTDTKNIKEKEEETTKIIIDTPKPNDTQKEIKDNDDISAIIIKEYLEGFKNPKFLREFILKWKITALDRLTSMSSKEDVILETSKKIIDLSNFWGVRDPDNDFILYILPGKVLWSRIGEILSDNSRFGYMNFNGIYELKEAKESTIVETAIGQKDESGKITIIEKGSANLLRFI
jgi:hypothetical protein